MVGIFWAAKKRHFWFQLSEFQEFFFLKIEKSPKIDKIIIHELFLKAPVRKPVGDNLTDTLKEIQFNLCTLCKHTVWFLYHRKPNDLELIFSRILSVPKRRTSKRNFGSPKQTVVIGHFFFFANLIGATKIPYGDPPCGDTQNPREN